MESPDSRSAGVSQKSSEPKSYFDTDEPCATCGKPMNDRVAMEECMRKWVPPNWSNLVNALKR